MRTSSATLLDLGPSGVEVPQVEDEATVDEALAYFYYPQFGNRSWGGAARRGIQGRDDRRTYAEWWNNYGVLWLQIESIEAITKARKLAKPGVDCLSFGPSDLSFSLEAHPEHPFKTVDDCVRYTVARCQGRLVCFHPTLTELPARFGMANQGFNVGSTIRKAGSSRRLSRRKTPEHQTGLLETTLRKPDHSVHIVVLGLTIVALIRPERLQYSLATKALVCFDHRAYGVFVFHPD